MAFFKPCYDVMHLGETKHALLRFTDTEKPR